MKLEDLRRDYNLSQLETARILETTQATVSRIESGIQELKISDLGKLINALDLNSEYYERLIAEATNSAKPQRKRRK